MGAQAARRVMDAAQAELPRHDSPEQPARSSSPAGSNDKADEDSGRAMELDEVDADVEVVCRPQKRGKDSGMQWEDVEGAEGVFHTRSMTVTCHCSTCKGGREFTPSQFEAHGGLGCNKRWRTSIFIKLGDAADGGRTMTIGAWLKGLALDSDCRRSLQRQQRHKLMPPGCCRRLPPPQLPFSPPSCSAPVVPVVVPLTHGLPWLQAGPRSTLTRSRARSRAFCSKARAKRVARSGGEHRPALTALPARPRAV